MKNWNKMLFRWFQFFLLLPFFTYFFLTISDLIFFDLIFFHHVLKFSSIFFCLTSLYFFVNDISQTFDINDQIYLDF